MSGQQGEQSGDFGSQPSNSGQQGEGFGGQSSTGQTSAGQTQPGSDTLTASAARTPA